MPDWQELVRQRLSGLALDSAEKEEVQVELAAHLEESYDALLREGMPEQAAVHRALSQVEDWQELRRRIQVARTMKENIMIDRVRQLWLPGFLTLVMSSGILALIDIYGPKPVALIRVGQPPMVLFLIPWLLSLPLVGAVGAYLSYRAGGSRRAIFSSIVFPVFPFLASILVVLPVSLIFDHFIGHTTAPMALLMALPGWVLAPGAALLIGALPIQILHAREVNSQRVAGA